MEGVTLYCPAFHTLPRCDYRIGEGGVCTIDGEETDSDTFAHMLAADCSDAS